jgi:signal transduction histidine kinase
MTTQPPTERTLETLLDNQDQNRTYRWALIVIPLICGVLASLLLSALFSSNPDSPLKLPLTALVAGGVAVATYIGLRRQIHKTLQQRPMAERIAQAIQEIEQVATEDNDHDAIVGTLRREIEAVLEPAAFEIALYTPSTNRYRIERHVKEQSSDVIGSLGSGHPFAVWMRQQPAGVPIDLAEARLSVDADPARGEMQARGIEILVPLDKQGWVGLAPPADRETFAPAQRNLLQLFCRPASIGLQRAALVEAQEKRAEELRALYWIAQAISFSMDIDDLMELIYTQLKRVVQLPSFYIALIDPDTDRFSFSFYVANDERLYPDDTWPSDAGLTGVIVQNNTTIRTESYKKECDRRDLTPGGSRIPDAWMGTALTAGDGSVGVMVASSFEPEFKFSEEDENFFVTVAAYTAAILERHTLYARLEARAHQLTTLNEIGNLLASSLDLDEVLDLVVRNAAALLNSEAGSLLLVDEETGDLIFRISSGPAGEQLVGMRIPVGKGIAGAAFSENRPVISQNTRTDKRWDASFDEKSEFVTESVIAVPLNARGRTIGVLEVLNRKDGRLFSEEDSELLLSFAAQAAIAIENARLFTTTDQALQARLDELLTMQQIDRQLNASLDYSHVMDSTLAWALRITEADVGIIAAMQEDDEGQALRVLAHRGYEDDVLALYLTEEELWPLEQGLVGQTVKRGATTLVSDVAADHSYLEVVPGMEAQLTVPIKREDHVIGVIALESNEIEAFNEEHVALIERLSDHAAIAIENARLFQQVQQANAAKTEFISFVSHELKQPMTSMKGYADLLTKGVGGELTEQQTQFVQVIRSNVTRMDRIVQDLLDVSRIESGRLKLQMEEIKPAEIVNEAVQAFEQEIAAKHQQLTVDVSKDLPTVVGDRGRLVQVLTNLISNANKYTEEAGAVTVRAERYTLDGHEYIRWSVSDTGIGMTQEEMDQLFTKYFRSKNPAVRSVQGTGLGLVISRSIIEMHDGHITVESQMGEGSTFSFSLPTASDLKPGR